MLPFRWVPTVSMTGANPYGEASNIRETEVFGCLGLLSANFFA